MHNTVQTAEEFYKSKFDKNDDVYSAMVEFAKLHVEAALQAVVEECNNESEKDFINDELILNSYSLSNIK